MNGFILYAYELTGITRRIDQSVLQRGTREGENIPGRSLLSFLPLIEAQEQGATVVLCSHHQRRRDCLPDGGDQPARCSPACGPSVRRFGEASPLLQDLPRENNKRSREEHRRPPLRTEDKSTSPQPPLPPPLHLYYRQSERENRSSQLHAR